MQNNNIKNVKIIENFVIFFAFCLIIFAFIPFKTNNVFAENDAFSEKISYNSSAKSAIVIDSFSKRILFEKNINERLPMASTTKIVTAITTIENCDDLDKVITVDDRYVGIEGSSIYLKHGEEISIRELLYGLMLRSGNDASVALAYAIAGGIDEFCEMMNNLAQKVGAKNSHFSNPHGLDDVNHFTTAYDLSLITSYALQNNDFAEIVKTKRIKICEEKENERLLVNKNKLLSKMDCCIGVKTGFTKKAGRCLVSACEKDGLKLVCVVLDCGPMFEESEDLFNLAYNQFKKVEILPPYYFVKSAAVKGGKVENVGLCTKRGFDIVLSKKELAGINVAFNAPDELNAPIKKDEIVGVCEIYYGNHLIFSENIYTIEEVDSILFKDKIKDILNNWNA